MNASNEAVRYTAEFVDGPLEGQAEQRILVAGDYERRVGMMAAVDGLESLFWYDAIDERDVAGMVHVRYRFDASDSDPVESDDEND
ncbi:hypothetical protein [Agromyces rhizosphaerae]|nr:hypothetical protein [Agromyces rhizosphaerae]